MSVLIDQAARTTALTALDRSLLVEAGAGSGKTSVLAGRIACLLAAGREPLHIAAVSFTEMAASELVGRVGSFVDMLCAGQVPIDLRAAFPNGVDDLQRANLRAARDRIGDLTATTIHGFCQRLLKPYPVEANMDPGARILDASEADLIFGDVYHDFLRERLSGDDHELDAITAFVAHDPEKSVKVIREIADLLRSNRNATTAELGLGDDPCHGFREAVREFRTFLAGVGYEQDETREIVEGFEEASLALPAPGRPAHSAAISILSVQLSDALVTQTGKLRSFRIKGKWEKSAPSKAVGGSHFAQATAHYERCCELIGALLPAAAACALSHLVEEIRPLIDAYRDKKRAAALLDFDDLLLSTRKMLRHHPEVRAALSDRYRHILVDEFQDTDPVQTEIFRLLAFDMPEEGRDWTPRPGAIFLVGDPKQAIYRFRGADVRAYVATRDLMRASDASSVLEVGTNFRSCRSIIEWVNEHFEGPLSAGDQPGFGRLAHHRDDHPHGPLVAAVDVEVGGSADESREAEAQAVADLCSRLVGSFRVHDKGTGTLRPCEPGDIALLAPVGTDLWRYEAALEATGLSVSTQAGKGMFRRQEIQDLIAVTRVLADPRDRLALGALLRGPLVGLTEEELLDATERLPPREDGSLPLLRVRTPAEDLDHPILKEVLPALARLHALALVTTPYDALCRAVEELNVRPILLARHEGRAERPLANVERFLEMCRPYALRGMRAFSDAMRSAWEEGERLGEGRPDAEERSVSLITMHSAKGLEWPVVIPINTLTEFFRAPSAILDAGTGILSMPILGTAPAGHEDAKEAYSIATAAERVRLWYVGTTRARDLLVLPRGHEGREKTWAAVVDLRIAELPAFDVVAHELGFEGSAPERENAQDAASFAGQASAIEAARRPVVWETPSRSEASVSASVALSMDDLVSATPETDVHSMISGSRERGTVLHKLMEEVLTGELAEEPTAVRARAAELTAQLLGRVPEENRDLNSVELAACVARSLALPEVAAIRDRLVPEVAVGATRLVDDEERAVYGVIDAAAHLPGGGVDVVVDWKSDVRPDPGMASKYREQVARYLKTVGASQGMVVFMTTGTVLKVAA